MKHGARQGLMVVMAAALWSPWAAVALADDEERPARGDERTARAEAQFREAVEAFASGRYYTAIELFTAADRIQPKPELSFDIARSYENLGEDTAAIAFYREYLRRAGHPADEADVLSRIDKLASKHATPGARPESDDDGPQLVATQTASGPFVGGSNGSAASAAAVRDSAGNGSGRVFTTMGWAGLGAAAVAFGGAAAFEIMRENAEDAAANERQQIRFDHYIQTMEADRTAARVLFGAGAALAVTGGILLFVGASRSHQGNKSLVAWGVSPERGGLSASASWRF